MSIVYEFDITAVCPVDGTRDTYEATIRCDEQINVETINQVAASYRHAVIYQEAMTREMHRRLQIAGSLETVGMHSGIRVTVTVGL